MNLVVLSDTHADSFYDLPATLQVDLSIADAVIHAGDIGTDSFYEELKAVSKSLYAVRGNNDSLPLPEQLILELEGVKIAVIHGHQASGDYIKFMLRHFSKENPNIIIYGHTHFPKVYFDDNITIFNPGSPTRKRTAEHFTYVSLTLQDKKYSTKIVKLNKNDFHKR